MRKLFLIIVTLVTLNLSALAQTSYSGTVVDAANNEPLIGATVQPIGGGMGTATDVDGKFTLTTNAKQIKVSYVGYKEQTVKLQPNMTVYLHSTTSNLDDLVVVAYGTANKESLTGSVAMVGSKEIEARPVTTVTNALEGAAPGVQVNNSTGTPGSSPTIRIRGFSSINGVNNPLYVVDGFPFEGSIADLNPNDIESMSVLKDAASCALYGNRGANGVILITTKRAKNEGKVDVTFQVRQGFNNRALPFYDRLDTNQWMQAQFDSRVNGDLRYYTVNAPQYGYTRQDFVDDWRNILIPEFLELNIYGVEDNKLFNEAGKFVGGSPLAGYWDRNWWDVISDKSGYRQEYNVNASGATEKLSVFASFGYLKDNGYIIGTDFDRFNGRLNATFTPTKFLKVGINLAATQQESMTGNVDSDNLTGVNNPFLVEEYGPIYPYYNHDEAGNVIYGKDGKPEWNTEGYNQGTNVAWEQRLNKNSFNKTAIDGSAFATVTLPYGFDFTVKGQMFRSKENILEYNNNVVGSQAGSGMITREFDDYRSHTFMQQLTWSHEYGLNHIDALLSHENYNYESKYDYIRKSEQTVPDHIDLNNFASMDYGVSGYKQIRTESWLGRARYNYDQKYYGEASIRRDGSSRFSKNCRWGTFWSVGASWMISKEKFMQNINWLTYLKLRADYGSVGNDQSAPAYAHLSYYDWDSYGGGTVTTLVPYFYGTPGLKWESTKTVDAALEGALFDDRFTFSVGYFNKQNSDLLFKMTLPASVGTPGGSGSGNNPTIWRNIATMENYGWELQFGVDIIRNANVKWNFNVDATFLKNKITNLPDGRNLPAQGLFIGKSIYEHVYLGFAGVDQLTGQSMYEIDPHSPDFMIYNDKGEMTYDENTFNAYVATARALGAAGQAVFIEKDGKYYTSNTSYASRKICGTALPAVYGSFGTNFSWKGINLGLLFTYSLGGKTYDGNYQNLMSTSTSVARALHKDVLKSWTAAPAGMTEDSPNRIDPNGIPELNADFSTYNNATSSRWLTSSSYVTLKNVNLSYDFPKNWSSAMAMQNLNLGVSIDNVFIAAKRKGMNPQYGFRGGQGRYYVPTRTVSFQLTAKF